MVIKCTKLSNVSPHSLRPISPHHVRFATSCLNSPYLISFHHTSSDSQHPASIHPTSSHSIPPHPVRNILPQFTLPHLIPPHLIRFAKTSCLNSASPITTAKWCKTKHSVDKSFQHRCPGLLADDDKFSLEDWSNSKMGGAITRVETGPIMENN